jgi:hypothetical protein
MTRYYIFKWYENSTNWGKGFIERTNKISIPKPTGDTSKDTKKALDLFIRGFGNLKQNTIISIKECDENGQIGEDIVPQNSENAIIPIGK